MRILVTGGAGFIGSALARRIINDTSHDVVVFDSLTYAGNLASLAPVADHERFTFVRGDVRHADAVCSALARFTPDAIMNLAAESHVDRSIEDPDIFIQTNVAGTGVLLQAATSYWRGLSAQCKAGFRFHHISTDEVYGSLGSEGRFTETTPYAPSSPYAASKAASDHLVRAWHHTYGLPTIITNCSNNYGPYHFPEKLIPLMIVNAVEGRALPVYGRGQNIRDWLYVDDHAQALLLAVTEGIPGETYNIGGNSEKRNIDVVHQICDLVDELAQEKAAGPRRQLVTYVNDRLGHDYRYAIDATKISRDLGWKAAHSFEEGLRKTVAWYLANRNWWQGIRSAAVRGEKFRAAAHA